MDQDRGLWSVRKRSGVSKVRSRLWSPILVSGGVVMMIGYNVPAAEVRSPRDAVRDPRVQRRGETLPLEHPEFGRVADVVGMGVPITFLDKYNPDQFDILGSSKTLGRPMSEVAKKGTFMQGGPRFYLPNGDGTYRRMYDRIVIRNKQL